MSAGKPPKLLEAKERMLKLNLLNWQYMVISNKGEQEPLNDYDSMVINNQKIKLMENSHEQQKILLPVSKLLVDVKTLEALDVKTKDDYFLTKAATSEAMKRMRPSRLHKEFEVTDQSVFKHTNEY